MRRVENSKPRLTVLFDAQGENWPSMDLAGKMLVSALRASPLGKLEVAAVQPKLPNVFRRAGNGRLCLNLDRALGRYLLYPAMAKGLRQRNDLFHVVDHSYAQLVLSLPPGKCGVFCYDLEAFKCLLHPEEERRPFPIRALARRVLSGLRKAAVVFVATQEVRSQLVSLGWVSPERAVLAPLGVAPEFAPGPSVGDRPEILSALGGRPFVLHVGSSAKRKRLDFLFEVFARLSARFPELCLVQQGGMLDAALREQVKRLKLGSRLFQPPPISRSELAGLYRACSLVLLPSDVEGFGLPLVEALACGAPVLASDLPVLREVGGAAVRYCPVGDVASWTESASRALGSVEFMPGRETRVTRASNFTWARHAGIIEQTYLQLLKTH